MVTQAFLPLLGTATHRNGPPGRIVQMSSVSAAMGFPLIGAYTASKFTLEGMSESLQRELMLYGIDVIVLNVADALKQYGFSALDAGEDLVNAGCRATDVLGQLKDKFSMV